MGSFAVLKIKDYELVEMRNYIEPSIMSIFSEDDRLTKIEYEDGCKEYHIYYTTNAKIAKTRLNIMGFNLITVRYTFELSKKQILDNFKGTEEDKNNFSNFLVDFTFNKYLSALKQIYEHKIDLSSDYHNIKYEEMEKIKKSNPHIKYILDDFDMTECKGFDDDRFLLRGFLEKLDDDTEIYIDITEVICAGYYDEDEKIAEQSLSRNDKTIIFTEGKYDTFTIKESMELLYPKYANYFSFLDIELSGLELNASRIITYIKSFIAAGIINKMIILFDNDAEGHFCKQKLLKTPNIPNNFSIKTYPDIEIAKNYPTICPTGIEKLDINKSGCSIELYLCEDILLGKNNEFIPIQWTSFDEIKKYQGSFSSKDKDKIQKKYSDILKKCKKDRMCISKYKFDNMKTLLEDIFIAFDDKVSSDI